MKLGVSKNGKIFVRRGVRGGWVQKAFKAQIGTPVGNCVKGRVPRGTHPGKKVVMDAIKDCAAPTKGIKLHRGGA